MEYGQLGTMSASATIGEYAAPAGPLNTAASRIHDMADLAERVAGRLRDHADTVFGSVPESDAKVGPSPVRAGQIGSLHDALDRMERVLGYVEEQASRNCSLA